MFFRTVELYCICQKPYIKGGPEMVKCGGDQCNCVKWFHQECAEPPVTPQALEQESWTWVSKFCWPPTAHWGGSANGMNLINTCPIDNGLTIFYLYALQRPSFLKRIESCKILK